MSNYIPLHTKKKQILARKEHVLERLVADGAAPAKVASGAQAVLDALIRALKAQHAQLAPSGVFDSQRGDIDERIQSLLNTSISELLLEFGHSPDPACSSGDS